MPDFDGLFSWILTRRFNCSFGLQETKTFNSPFSNPFIACATYETLQRYSKMNKIMLALGAQDCRYGLLGLALSIF